MGQFNHVSDFTQVSGGRFKCRGSFCRQLLAVWLKPCREMRTHPGSPYSPHSTDVYNIIGSKFKIDWKALFNSEEQKFPKWVKLPSCKMCTQKCDSYPLEYLTRIISANQTAYLKSTYFWDTSKLCFIQDPQIPKFY